MLSWGCGGRQGGRRLRLPSVTLSSRDDGVQPAALLDGLSVPHSWRLALLAHPAPPASSGGGSVCLTCSASESRRRPGPAPRRCLSLLCMELWGGQPCQCISLLQETLDPLWRARGCSGAGWGPKRCADTSASQAATCSEVALLDPPLQLQ